MDSKTKEKFINITYNQGMNAFLSEYGMKLLPTEFSNLKVDPKLFCCSKELRYDFLQKCIVVGGPCIKDCENAVTIGAIYEIFNIIKTAKTLNTKAVIFIGLYEEAIKNGGKQSYDLLKNNLDNIVNAFSVFFEYKNITVIDTREKFYNSLMKEYLTKTNNFFNVEKLNAIFELGKHKYKAHDDFWIIVTKRVAIAHTPSFLNAYLGNKNNENILVVENTQQIKIVKLAKKIDSSKNGPYQLAYLPVPAVSGSERMYRAPYWDKIYLNEPRNKLDIKQLLAPEEVFNFWMEMFIELKNKKSYTHLYQLISTLNFIIYNN